MNLSRPKIAGLLFLNLIFSPSTQISMNCYNHQTVPAVAICKNCNKGLCPQCLTEVENGIACTSTCVEEVKTINALISRNKNLTKRATGNYNRAVFIYFAMALLFFYSGFTYAVLRYYMFPAGAIFLFISIWTLIAALKVKKA